MSTDLNDLTCKIVVVTDLMREPPDERAPSEALEAQDHAGLIQLIGRGWDRALAVCRCSSSKDDGIREVAHQIPSGTRTEPSRLPRMGMTSLSFAS